jgi:hypothetical protein
VDPTTWIELAKVGGPILAIAVVLLFVTLRDKDRMAAELRELNAVLRGLVENNTAAMVSMRDLLDGRPCLFRKDK